MSEMVERVARAQCASAGHRLEEFNMEEREAALALARVAIEAMREPTKTMCDVGNDAAEGARWGDYVWGRMIDAALALET